MNFCIIDKQFLGDKTLRLKLKIKDEDLVYLGYIIEAYEGWCNYTTVKKPSGKFLQIDVVPDYIDNFMELLNLIESYNYEE